MSANRLEIARRGLEMFNARDVDGMAEVGHPDFVWRSAMGTPESREYHGLDGMREYRDDLDAGFRDLGFEVVASGGRLGLGLGDRTPLRHRLQQRCDRKRRARRRDQVPRRQIASIESFPSAARAREIAEQGAAS